MGRLPPESINSFEFANESISWISGYENEAAVDDASRQIARALPVSCRLQAGMVFPLQPEQVVRG